MKHTNLYRTMLCLVLVVLLAAAAFTGCAGKKDSASASDIPEETFPASGNDVAEDTPDGGTELGAGETTFYFSVTDKAGQTTSYTIHTDAETVGAALLENGLIEGEEGEYGLYVTTVCGETLDWDTDQMYWAFYEGDEYAATGVDSTAITDGASYAFIASN